jgi:putative MATE family efflux protein
MSLNSEFLGKENVHQLMLTFGSFAVIAMLATGTQTVINTFIMSRGIDIYAVSAVGILFPLVTVYFGFSQLVAIGAASYISRMLGKNKKEEVLSAIIISYALTLLISILLMIGTWIFKENILSFLGATGDAEEHSRTYLSVFIYSIPFTAMVLLSSAIFRAYGKLKLSMLVILVESGLIIALDYLLIYVFRNGIGGAALSHVLAGIISSIFGIILLIKLNKKKHVKKGFLKWDIRIFNGLLSVGLSALGRSLAGAAFALVLNHTITQLGEADSLAAFGAVNRIILFLVYAVMGVSQAMQPIVSYNFTAKKSNRVKAALKYALIYSGIIGLVGTLLGIFLPHQVVRIFTSNTEVLDDAALIFKMQLVLFFTIGLQTLTATYYQAIGKAWMSFFLSVFKPLIILIPLVYFLPRILNSNVASIWWAFPIADILSTVVCFLILRKNVKNLTPRTNPIYEEIKC